MLSGFFSGLLNPNMVPLLDSTLTINPLIVLGYLFFIFFGTVFSTALLSNHNLETTQQYYFVKQSSG
tara:strand:+ start:3326 stop:3526 length:201 start_codon:yes stop_codon:yes gene_type:complete